MSSKYSFFGQKGIYKIVVVGDWSKRARAFFPSFAVLASVEDRNHFDVDPDSAFHFDADMDPIFHSDADPDPTFQMMRIRILPLAFPLIWTLQGSKNDLRLPHFNFDASTF